MIRTSRGDRSFDTGLAISGFLSLCSAVGSKNVDCLALGDGIYVVGLGPAGGGERGFGWYCERPGDVCR